MPPWSAPAWKLSERNFTGALGSLAARLPLSCRLPSPTSRTLLETLPCSNPSGGRPVDVASSRLSSLGLTPYLLAHPLLERKSELVLWIPFFTGTRCSALLGPRTRRPHYMFSRAVSRADGFPVLPLSPLPFSASRPPGGPCASPFTHPHPCTYLYSPSSASLWRGPSSPLPSLGRGFSTPCREVPLSLCVAP